MSLIEILQADNGWISVITGSGGALVVLMMWVRIVNKQIAEKDEQLRSISLQSVECITKILSKIEDEEKWKKRIESIINSTHLAVVVREAKNNKADEIAAEAKDKLEAKTKEDDQ